MKVYGINGKRNIAGSRIKLMREKSNLTQTEVAAKLQLVNVNLEQKSNKSYRNRRTINL